MWFRRLFVAHATFLAFNVEAAPFSGAARDQHSTSAGLESRGEGCEPGPLSNETWVKDDVDSFLANASQHYTQYPNDNVQALGAYLGAPNFFCGVSTWCYAGQPCSPVTLPGWYVLMAIQGWNNYVNNLNFAVEYSATILSLKLGKVVNDLWPARTDNVTPMKQFLAWINGILNAFPTTAAFGATAGSIASTVQGGNIIGSAMMVAPSAGDQFVRWSDLSSQMGTNVDEYKKAIATYAQKVIDAPIADPQWGINKVLAGGAFLTRGQNVTQDDIDTWMYRSVSVNAMALLMQAQNVYIIRTFNKTECDDQSSAILCRLEPNNKWTEWRFQRRRSDDDVPEYRLAQKLVETYGLSKEEVLKGPADCFDSHDYEQLTNPWETLSEKGASTEPLQSCNFNVNVCNFDAAEGNEYGPVDIYEPGFTDWMCELQGITWT
ncbi:hypothetical protein CCHL11_03587 [Colletotrichum chlorophyti]|uniref:DUF7872 domain-containing protein n=1 Tax=Colletotrichum chlorophyti TaxID=708187 RepID=A0A1Q8RSG1_9PEZI|nr:hypothetical protein CCHL11_03587 [Colletotrichum chlorophyti]